MGSCLPGKGLTEPHLRMDVMLMLMLMIKMMMAVIMKLVVTAAVSVTSKHMMWMMTLVMKMVTL